MEIRYFLGANSAVGFHSHYDQLLSEQNRRMIRILKGGSGCGKSTLMKKVAAHAEQMGLIVHRILCSSDPDSLDGIAIPEAGYAIVDGTAPHVVEPQLCGCGESYIDLGAGYDTEKLHTIRHILLRIRHERQNHYPPATANLLALANVEQLKEPAPKLSLSVIEKEIPEQGGFGQSKQIFLSAHTPKGRITCWETVAALCPKVIALRSTVSEIGRFIHRAEVCASSRGWDSILCDSSLLPGSYPEHLLIPALGLAFVSDTQLSPYPGNAFLTIGTYPEHEDLSLMQRTLLRSATDHLKQAKSYHDLLESAYAPFMDYSCANEAALNCCAELEMLR